MRSKTVVAIVDPFSSGSQLAREVRSRDHGCVMVNSVEEIPPMYRSSFHAEDFDAIVQHRGNLEETCEELASRNVGCVLAGCEMGVELADDISERLGLVSNGTRLSPARRNKALMGETLRKRGVRTPAAFSTAEFAALKDWIHAYGKWPIVLKPLCSSGSDGVFVCSTQADVQTAFDKIMTRKDVFGSANKAVLVQEFLIGTEYAIDTVSCHGRHKVAAFWQYSKSLAGESFLGIDSMELLAYSSSLHHQLLPYVASVLDALELTNGPAHCELVWSADGPVIVEIGARLNGGNNPMLSRYCGGESQIDWTLDAYLDPASFLSRLGEPYELTKFAMRVFLIPRQLGRLKSSPDFEAIKRLDSFHEMRFSARPGQSLSRIAGWVLLVHHDRDVLHHDLDEIRRMEMLGLYPIDPES